MARPSAFVGAGLLPFAALGAAPVKLEKMPFNGEVGLGGKAHKQLVEGAILEGDHDAAVGADEVVHVPREARRIADLAALRVDAGEPTGAAQLLKRAVDGGAARVFVASGLDVGVELLGSEGGGVAGDRREDAQAWLGDAPAAAKPSAAYGVRPRLGVDAGGP